MPGGEHTKRRLQSVRPSHLGKWERVQDVWKAAGWVSFTGMLRLLPPECIASRPQYKHPWKVRSPRPDVSLRMVALALETTDQKEFLEMLDKPLHVIETYAAMNQLKRMVR